MTAGLGLAQKFKVMTLQVFSNSTLMVNQVNGMFTVVNPIMVSYINKVK